jgi:DNA uptake protein ComE-like DNA-binding protein
MPPASAARTPDDVQTSPAQACVDINTANVEALQEIIHIGPQRAVQIIELRKAQPFRSVDDLVRVKGIAAKRLADIKRQGVACVK